MNRRHSPALRSATGLSLIELMIAMAIGVVLLLGLIQVMSASRSAYQLSTGVARTQENARFAVDFLQRDMRMAGHMGCVNDQAHMAPELPGSSDVTRQGLNLWFLTAAERTARNFAALNNADFPLRFDLGVQGFEAQGTAPTNSVTLSAGTPAIGNANQWVPNLPTNVADLQPMPGSDIVVLRFLSRDGVPATLTRVSATQYNIVPESYGIEVSTKDSTGLFGLTDCQQASVFSSAEIEAATGAVTVRTNGALNESGLLGGKEQTLEANKPMLYRAEAVVYYVGRGAGTNVDGTNPPSLWRAHAVYSATGGLEWVREELVEGVESMQLLYGMDENLPTNLPRGNMQRMRIASAVNAAPTNNPNNAQGDEWRRVGSIQVGLLMRSSDRSAAEQSVDTPVVSGVRMLRGAGDTVSDGHYRSVYETTVVMRNRLFGN